MAKELDAKLKKEISEHKDTKDNLEKAIREIEDLKTIYNSKIEKLEKDVQQREKDIASKYKKDMEQLISSHYKETEELKAQFDNAIALLNEKYN